MQKAGERCLSRGGSRRRGKCYIPPLLLPSTLPPAELVNNSACVCRSVGPAAARTLFLFPPSSVRWRHILLENTPAAYVQSGGAGKREGKSYHLLLVGRKQYFSRRCLPPPCLAWARRPFPKRAILATRHKKEEGRRRKTAAHFLTCMPDRPRHTQVFLFPFSSSLGENATIWQQKGKGGDGMQHPSVPYPPLSSGPPPIFPLSCARAK